MKEKSINLVQLVNIIQVLPALSKWLQLQSRKCQSQYSHSRMLTPGCFRDAET